MYVSNFIKDQIYNRKKKSGMRPLYSCNLATKDDIETAGGVAPAHLEVNVGGYNTEQTIPIVKHQLVKVGRNDKECQLVLTNPSISSVHCVFWCVFFDEDSIPMFYVKDCSLNGTYLNGLLLKRDKTYLLKHCDVIELSQGSEENDIKKTRLVFMINDDLQSSLDPKLLDQMGFLREVDQWEITNRIVGNGTFGHVLITHNSKERDEDVCYHPENYAVKIIKLKPNKFDKEARILLRLDHPNIIKVYHTFCDRNNHLYIFQDLIPGGDLFSYLAKGDCLTSMSETESLLIVFQILQALNYLHDQDIVHRDLKLDNILLCTPEPCTRIVLADFGIAKDLNSNKERMHTVVGTPEYCAPEVGFRANRKAYQSFSRAATLEQRGYDSKCDLWSLGVITHIMLTGISPFYGDGSERSIIQNAKIGKLNFKLKQWDIVSDNAKSFVKDLLQTDVVKRLNSKQGLKHIWIAKHLSQLERLYYKKILCNNEGPKLESINSDWKRKLPKSVIISQAIPKKKKVLE